MTPTARSMKYFRDQKVPCCRVEQRLPIPGKFVTKDAFGFGDLLVLGYLHYADVVGPHFREAGISLIQVTSTANLNAREEKIRGIPEAVMWAESGGRIFLQGWSKKGPRGKRKVWTLTEREITRSLNGKT
jgi:hypothetical protein